MPALALDQAQFDSQVVTFAGENLMAVTFADAFASAPQVIANARGSVNVWTSGVTQTGVTVHVSLGWTGDVLVQAIGRK
jgi:hypothetical protein